MQCQVLSSGSKGNCTLVRAGDLRFLVDAGLTLRALTPRLEAAGVPFRGLDHILVTHGHLDHARSAGALAKRHQAVVHCPEAMMQNRSVARAPRLSAVSAGRTWELEDARRPGQGTGVAVKAQALPHDCHPTLAYRVDFDGRRLVVLTDIGRVDESVAQALQGAHVLKLEFNHCAEMLHAGPYPDALKRRVGGGQGHLNNDQAAAMLERLAGPELHTLILAHLSAHNNTPDRALEAALTTLQRLGLSHVQVMVAQQDEALAPIDV